MQEDANPVELPPGEADVVRSHLRQVLASAAFGRSRRAQDFLRVVVEHALAGRLDNLRERMLGSEMFGREVGYDTANDAVVRVKASDVRRRLAAYYQNLKVPPTVRIDLPTGSYVPHFQWTPVENTPFMAVDTETDVSSADPELNSSIQASSPPLHRSTGFSLRPWMLLAPAIVFLAVAGVFTYYRLRGPSLDHPIRSIAILPLVNFSGDPSQEYFADGMTEELTAELGQVGSLRVISRTSAMTYKGTKKTLPEIARELSVDGVVEGSIERERNRVRTTVQLIDSRTDEHVWAHTFDRDMTSVLEIQSDVARAIANQIQAELTLREQTQLNRTQEVNPEAVDLYLQGMHQVDRGNPESGIEFFRKAIEKDPNYGDAHASLANAYGWMGEAGSMPYSQAFGRERAEAMKAIELGDTRPQPYLDLGFAAMDLNWDWKTLGQNLRRALELNPNADSVHWAYANYLARIGRTNEAVVEAKLALQLDPVSSRSYQNTSFIDYYARQYDQALEQIRKAEALNATEWELLFPAGVIYVEKDFYDLAFQKFLKLGDAPHALGHLGNAYARAGRIAEARAILPRLEEHIDKTGIGRYEIALVYAGLKENDHAFEWLEKAFQARDKGLTYLKIDPCLDPLRSDPRFESLVKRVGFPSNP